MIDPHFDEHQFQKLHTKVVTKDHGIAHSDYERMHQTRPQKSGKLTKPPIWALDDELLRPLIVQYLENRYYLHPGINCEAGLSLEERIKRIEWNVPPRIEQAKCNLAVALARYEQWRDRIRAQKVQEFDTRLVVEHKGMFGLVTAIVYMYWRMDMNSVDVAEQLGIKSPHVREILWRLGRVWKEMNPDTAPPERVTGRRPKAAWTPRPKFVRPVWQYDPERKEEPKADWMEIRRRSAGY